MKTAKPPSQIKRFVRLFASHAPKITPASFFRHTLKGRSVSVVGKAIISPKFKPPSKSLIGQTGTFYIPKDDKAFDLVYVCVGDETFVNSFAALHWKRAADSRIPSDLEIR
jgi:hypothetical protein